MAASGGRELSRAAGGELAALRSSQAAEARTRRRQQCEAWARHAMASPVPQSDHSAAHRRGSGRPPREPHADAISVWDFAGPA